MVRRIASQVHQQAARLLRSKFLRREPVWFQAVLQHPPLPLPPRKPQSRPEHDLPPSDRVKLKPHEPRPLPIYYIEDDVRRQFYRDHPFEAWKPVSLVEGGVVAPERPLQGPTWTRLRQWGRNPSVEDAVRFCLNLHQHHGLSISQAYARAVQQFRALRAEHHVATMTAALEAEEHGAVFGIGEITRSFLLEGKMFQDSYDTATKDEDVSAANKRWRAILDKKTPTGKWSKGQAYVRHWKTGVRPTLKPARKAVKPPKLKPPKPTPQDSVQHHGPMKQVVDHFGVGPA